MFVIVLLVCSASHSAVFVHPLLHFRLLLYELNNYIFPKYGQSSIFWTAMTAPALLQYSWQNAIVATVEGIGTLGQYKVN